MTAAPFLQLDEWLHPNVAGEELPSQAKSFQMIAGVVASGDGSRYDSKSIASNTHWKHWDHLQE